eukprot:9054-Heterococcus_DN1.PRE.6
MHTAGAASLAFYEGKCIACRGVNTAVTTVLALGSLRRCQCKQWVHVLDPALPLRPGLKASRPRHPVTGIIEIKVRPHSSPVEQPHSCCSPVVHTCSEQHRCQAAALRSCHAYVSVAPAQAAAAGVLQRCHVASTSSVCSGKATAVRAIVRQAQAFCSEVLDDVHVPQAAADSVAVELHALPFDEPEHVHVAFLCGDATNSVVIVRGVRLGPTTPLRAQPAQLRY